MLFAENETLKRPSSVSPSTLRTASGGEHEFVLEGCGRWLLGIPRDEISVLSRTDEYQTFIHSFDSLESAYRRVISTPSPPTSLMLPSSHSSASAAALLLESDDAESSSSSSSCGQMDVSEKSPHISSHKIRSLSSAPVIPPAAAAGRQSCTKLSRETGCLKCSSVRGTSGVSREENLLQQFLKADDVLIRIFEFLESKSLIQTSKVCSRFRVVSEQSAKQRTFRLARERQLTNAMQLLRVQEQLNGVAWGGGDDNVRTGKNMLHVRVPILLLGRVVVVRDAGDPEFNGTYSCTDCSSNGFVFTKPIQQSSRTKRNVSAGEGQDGQQNRTQAGILQERQHQQQVLPDAFLRAVFGIHPQGQHGPNDQIAAAGNGNQQQEATPLSENHTGRPTNLIRHELSKEEETKRPLRCIISKKWSGEHLLWYMGKEEEDGETGNNGRVPKLTCSYWAPLSVGNHCPADLHNYPSTSSYLLSRGQQWRPLSNIQRRNAAPPVVELMD